MKRLKAAAKDLWRDTNLAGGPRNHGRDQGGLTSGIGKGRNANFKTGD
jgi:hypothetical protein